VRNLSASRGNSITLGRRPQFARKASGLVNSPSSKVARIPARKVKSRPNTRVGRKGINPTRKPRNNWDLYFREGIVKRKG